MKETRLPSPPASGKRRTARPGGANAPAPSGVRLDPKVSHRSVSGLGPQRAAWVDRHPELFTVNNWRAPVALLSDYAVVVAMVLLVERWHPWLPAWVWYVAVALPVISARMRGLATILHEAVHRSLTRNQRLARFLATYGSGHLIGQTWTAYLRSHLRDHHGHFSDPVKDPDYAAHLARGLYERATARRFIGRYLLLPLFGVDHPPMWRELVRARMGNLRDPKMRREVLTMAATLVVVLGTVAALAGPRIVLLYWAIPFLYGFPLVNWYLELSEHYPYVQTRSDNPLWHARERATGPVTRQFIGIHGEHHHWVHHEFPTMPYWHQRKALRLLEREVPEVRAMVEEQGADGWHPLGFTRQFVAAGREAERVLT